VPYLSEAVSTTPTRNDSTDGNPSARSSFATVLCEYAMARVTRGWTWPAMTRSGMKSVVTSRTRRERAAIGILGVHPRSGYSSRAGGVAAQPVQLRVRMRRTGACEDLAHRNGDPCSRSLAHLAHLREGRG